MAKGNIKFSVLNRKKQVEELQIQKFDLAIIGGGVTGAGIALDAASRGLKVCLIEKNDFASGTSSKSTKLIHGGLRYLKQFEVGLVRESGSERAIVHKLAPHLVLPEKMLLPLIKNGTYGKLMTSIGLMVYDFLANVKGKDKRKMLNKKKTLEKEPLLNKDTVLGSGFYAEYRTDDARLTIEILKKAASYGANIINYCEMESFNYNEKSKIESLNCIDYNSGDTFKIKAINYVSAAGPWVDKLRIKDKSKNNKSLHLTKGVHIVFPSEKLPIKQSIYFDVPDGRMIFAIPRGRVTYVGTTDTNYYSSLERVVTTKNDADYILKAINATFPTINVTIKDIESNWAGLRPLIHENGKDPSELSRKDEIFISDSGLISIAGGKLTGYRKMAHRVINAVTKTMKKERQIKFEKSKTKTIHLITPSLNSSKEVIQYQNEITHKLKNIGINTSYEAWYLCTTYGKHSDTIILKSKDFENKNVLERLIRAELWYCTEYEMINSLTDFFVRRTGRLYFNISSVTKYLEIVVEDCSSYLKWDAEKIKIEREKLNLILQDATTYYTQEF